MERKAEQELEPERRSTSQPAPIVANTGRKKITTKPPKKRPELEQSEVEDLRAATGAASGATSNPSSISGRAGDYFDVQDVPRTRKAPMKTKKAKDMGEGGDKLSKSG